MNRAYCSWNSFVSAALSVFQMLEASAIFVDLQHLVLLSLGEEEFVVDLTFER